MLRSRSLVLALLLAGCAPGRAQDTEVRTYRAPNDVHEMHLPASWRVTPVEDVTAIFSFDVLIPRDAEHEDGVRMVARSNEGMRFARAQLFFDRPRFERALGATKTEVAMEPLPHMVIHYASDGEGLAQLCAYRVVRGWGLYLVATLRESDVRAHRDALLAAAAGMTAARSRVEPPPEGYRERDLGSFRYLIHRGLESSVEPLDRVVRKHLAAFSKLHGAIPATDVRPEILLVPRLSAAATLIGRDLAAGRTFHCDDVRQRLFATPLPTTRTGAEMGELLRELTFFCYASRYGNLQPLWLAAGEAGLAYQEGLTGSGLPTVSRDLWTRIPATLLRLDELTQEAAQADWEAFGLSSLAYRALFRLDGRYRKSCDAFLRTAHESGDWEAAQRAHLGALDQEELRDAAQRNSRRGLEPTRK